MPSAPDKGGVAKIRSTLLPSCRKSHPPSLASSHNVGRGGADHAGFLDAGNQATKDSKPLDTRSKAGESSQSGSRLGLRRGIRGQLLVLWR